MAQEDDKKTFEEVARLADDEAEQHDDECAMNGFYKDVASAARAMAAGHGPAQVASHAYRSNYETIFGKRVNAGQA